MFFLILIGIVFLGGTIWAIKDREWIIILIALTLCACLFILSIFPTLFINEFAEPSQTYETQEKYLMPINSENLYIEANITDKTKSYCFMEKSDEEDFAINLYTVPSNNSKIYKDNPTQPYVKIEKRKYPDILHFFFLFLRSEEYYEFHI